MPFTPLQATLGGLTLGLSTYWHYHIHGKILGVSGILRRATHFNSDALLFILGLLLSSHIPLHPSPKPLISLLPPWHPPLAGFLLGLAATLANGCTSGHGICGVARRSKRSLVATCTFMTTAILTATATNLADTFNVPASSLSHPAMPDGDTLLRYAVIILVAALLPPLLAVLPFKAVTLRLLFLFHGLTFGLGLIMSDMISPAKTAAFLDVSASWDPSLPFVFVGALPIAFLAFRSQQPLIAKSASLPTSTKVDARLVGGAALFGFAWGWTGVCPAPALAYWGGWGEGWQSVLGVVLGGGVGELVVKKL